MSNEFIPIIGIGGNLLSSYYDARNLTRTVSSLSSTTLSSSRLNSPAISTPWELDDQREGEDRGLIGRYNQIREQSNFIDLDTSFIKGASGDIDRQALFALYGALKELQSIADYAAQERTPEVLLSKLSSQFKTGLSQVSDYIRDTELDKLTLMLGKKEPRITSDQSLGKDNDDIY